MKKLLRVLCVVLLVLSMAGCKKKLDLSGTYQLNRLDSDEDSVTAEDMETLRSLGMDVLLTLEKDGTGVLDVFGEKQSLTYDIDKMTVTVGGESVEMKYANGELSLIDPSGTMVFVPKS